VVESENDKPRIYVIAGHALLIACPHCGHTERLTLDVVGNWECEKCEQEFFILDAKIVVKDYRDNPPTIGV
jgi:ribosomal protein L37AE/L43A